MLIVWWSRKVDNPYSMSSGFPSPSSWGMTVVDQVSAEDGAIIEASWYDREWNFCVGGQ